MTTSSAREASGASGRPRLPAAGIYGPAARRRVPLEAVVRDPRRPRDEQAHPVARQAAALGRLRGCLSLADCALMNPGDSAGRAGPGARYLPAPLRRPHGGGPAEGSPRRTLTPPPRDRAR